MTVQEAQGPATVANTGAEFGDDDVVRCYAYRTDYPEALHHFLTDLGSDRTRLLDLGCGPGKLARALSGAFGEVLAVDPSPAMLRLGQNLDAGRSGNVRWIEGAAEDLVLDQPVSLAVAGASLHWMDPTRVFPKLNRALVPGGVFAVIDGDGPADAPWIEPWRSTIKGWVARMGGVWNDAAHRDRAMRHLPWFEVLGRRSFSANAVQDVRELLEAEHSRATWARSKMGDRAAEFDADLMRVLSPWIVDGKVEFETRTEVVWGHPRARPAE